MSNSDTTTLNRIHCAAKKEFYEKGYKTSSLRNIVKNAGMTTGAFYGYYRSKEELFSALVEPHYNHFLNMFKEAQTEFAKLPPEEQSTNLSKISGACMYDMLYYAYDHLEEFKLILCCSEGTRFAGLIDEMVDIETTATHDYLNVLKDIGKPSPEIDASLEHILITGMFGAFFEIIIHEMPLPKANTYLKEMREFYTAGWMKIMGQ